MEIIGVSHPVPTKYAKRIYSGDKDVFIGKRCLCKVSPGDKFILYESQGARAYTGWGDITFIGRMKPNSIMSKYKDNLMINKEEFEEYSKGRREMFVIKFKNFQKFKNPVKPKRFVAVGGKYIYKDEFSTIKKKRS